MEQVIALLIVCSLPFLFIKYQEKIKFIQIFGTAVVCYLAGLIFSFFLTSYIGIELIKSTTELSLILSLPLLLINTKLDNLIKVTPKLFMAFIISIITVGISIYLVAYFYKDFFPEVSQLSAASMALFSGGTVNLSSLYLAINIEEHIFLTIIACDFLVGATYFLITLKISHMGQEKNEQQKHLRKYQFMSKLGFSFVGYTLLLNAIVIGASYFIYNKLNGTFIIITLTIISVVFANKSKLPNIRPAEDWGEYFLMLFCLLIGMQLDPTKFSANAIPIISFFCIVLLVNFLLYYPSVRILKIPFHQSFIAHIAAIFGPPFVVIIAKTMKRDDLMAPGIAVGSLGIAIGTFLGILMYNLL